MKTKIAISILMLSTLNVLGQTNSNNSSSASSSSSSSSTTTTVTETSSTGPRSYFGFSAGYLFRNKKTFNNPMYYLDNGHFMELNVGNRNGVFGWSAALGYLTIKRNPKQFESIYANSQMVYDSTLGPTLPPTSSVSGLDKNPIHFDPAHDIFEYKPFRGFYLMTGPNIWLGKNKFQFNGALEGGIGFSQIGYYAVAGKSPKGIDSTPLSVQSGTIGNYDMNMSVYDVSYAQYGMSDKYFNKLSTSSLSNPFTTKEPYQLHFMARLTANAEYFVTPKISLHGGANLWYIGMPKMNGAQSVAGVSEFVNLNNAGTFTNGQFSYTDPYAKNDLMYLSANAGIKFWMGKDNYSKTTSTTTTSQSATAYEKEQNKINSEQKAASKNVMITVVDDLTKTPMGGVAVTLKNRNGGADINAITKDNGTVEIQNVAPGDYDINGQIYSVATTSNNIANAEFAGSNTTIQTTLLYKDLRFILKGVAVNLENGNVEGNVKVNLENGAQTVSNTATKEDGNFQFLLNANKDYEVQGLKNGLFSNTEKVTTKGLDRSQTLFVKLQLGMNTVQVGKSFVLNDILYDLNDANIRPDAALELNRLAAFMIENPDVKIELSSHTDSRGTTSANNALSQRRAQSAVDYLASRGIGINRLIAKGYGETRLVNKCADGVPCSEAEHQQNRRTEIKIIE